MMKILRALSILIVLAFVSGCAVFNSAIGTSVTALEQEKVRYSKTFDKDIGYCYEKTLEALKKWQADIFMQKDKNYIVAMKLNKVFNSCIDTTEIGIFFKEEGAGKTNVDVASLNHYLGAFAAENLFKYIENPEAPTCPMIKDEPLKLK